MLIFLLNLVKEETPLSSWIDMRLIKWALQVGPHITTLNLLVTAKPFFFMRM